MSNDRYYGTAGRSRRGTPVLDVQNSGFFTAGQGGRTVLPPIASAFPSSRSPVPIDTYSTYSQPQRYSPPRHEYDTGYPQWANATSQQPMYYDAHHEPRTTHQHAHNSYPSPVTPTMQLESHDHHSSGHMSSGGHHIRSPTAVYPTPAYPNSSHATPYVYPTMNTYDSTPNERNYSRGTSSRNDHRSGSTYIASPVTTPTYIPQRAAAAAEDGSIIKKKRKRADAQQLKVLNDTYNRTAFPSTEERADLARRLDMSARSVQIWFQNKRQSLRQTKSQTSSASANQPFVVSPQVDSLNDDLMQNSMVSGLDSHAYIPRSMQPDTTSSRHHMRYDVDGNDSRLKRSSRAGY